MTVTKAKATFSKVFAIASSEGQRIVVKKRTRPIAVILGYADFQHLAGLEDRYQSTVLTKSLKEDRFLPLGAATKRAR